jgi:hypothetical protein
VEVRLPDLRLGRPRLACVRSGVFGPSEIADANGGDLLAPADPARRESLHIGIIRAQAAVEAHQFKSSIRPSRPTCVRSGSFWPTEIADANGAALLTPAASRAERAATRASSALKRRGGGAAAGVEHSAVQDRPACGRNCLGRPRWRCFGSCRTRTALDLCSSWLGGLITRREARDSGPSRHRIAPSLPFASTERQVLVADLK